MSKKDKYAEAASNNENMEKDIGPFDAEENSVQSNDAAQDEQIEATDNIINGDGKNSEVELLKQKLEEKENELKGYIDLAQRVKAEFDNYRKRSVREKEQQYAEISCDIIVKFLPIFDNLERAVSSAPKTEDTSKLVEGIEMTIKQFKEILGKEGVEPIEAVGAKFDPAYHNAVMHIEDGEYDDNVVVEEFQKGYKIKEKVLRYSMVKVAN